MYFAETMNKYERGGEYARCKNLQQDSDLLYSLGYSGFQRVSRTHEGKTYRGYTYRLTKPLPALFMEWMHSLPNVTFTKTYKQYAPEIRSTWVTIWDQAVPKGVI